MTSVNSPSWIPALRDSLPVTRRCVYLQTGSKGPLSEAVLKALHDAEWLAASEGPVAPAGKAPLVAAAAEAREALAELLRVPARELCWSLNTSTAMRTVMHTLTPCKDDVLITSDLEHVATRSLCQGIRDNCRATISTVATEGEDDAFLARLEEALLQYPGKRKVVILSHVSCLDGRRLPVTSAATLARRHGAISLIDGAQAVGQFPVDVGEIDADFYVGSGHKWLMGPSGIGYIHIHAGRLRAFNPNWLPQAERVDAFAAMLGEAGSVNLAPRAGLLAALEQMLRIGLAEIEAHVSRLSRQLREGLGRIPGIALLGPEKPGQTTGIVSLMIDGWRAAECERLVEILYRTHGVLIKYQPERTALRVSLAAFNTGEEVDLFLRTLNLTIWAIHQESVGGQAKETH